MATRSLAMITASWVGFTSWIVACGPKSDDAKTPAAVEAAIAPTAAPASGAERSPASRTDLKPSIAAPPSASSRGDHAPFAEIDLLCAAIDHDYIDGTLSTTFRGVALRSPAGQRLLSEAKTADRPGRHVLAAAHLAAPELAAPELTNCRKLNDYIDDVE